jgi:methylated-DNA-[protein]-cysteine S-methyltransferase
MLGKGECSESSKLANRLIRVCIEKRGDTWFGAAVNGNRVVATCFSAEEIDVKDLVKRLSEKAPFEVVDADEFLATVFDELDSILSGKDVEGFGVDVSRCSDYAQRVLWCTGLVPVGYVTSYGAIARVVGGSARSVGRVEASNPVPLLIPCHRVVCSDLSLGGYGFGKKTKIEILQKEDRGYEESKWLDVDGKKLALFPVGMLKQKDIVG